MWFEPPFSTKEFLVKCNRCKIEEKMLFTKRNGYSGYGVHLKKLLSGRYSDLELKKLREGKGPLYKSYKLPLFYKVGAPFHQKESDRKVFKPIRTILGDRLRKRCPVCNGKLEIREIINFLKY